MNESNILGFSSFTLPILTDSRGEFRTWFAAQNIGTDLSNFTVMQSNISKSVKSVIRGIHFSDATYEQTKIITCVSGAIRDYAIDLRTQSKTFGVYDSVELSENNGRTAVLKHGLGHAFEVLSETATIVYLLSSQWNPSKEFTINPFDSELAISWLTQKPIVSDRDREGKSLKYFRKSGNLLM
jgi:dTDP-4-dehydrorhamnose 3,5-epimerase